MLPLNMVTVVSVVDIVNTATTAELAVVVVVEVALLLVGRHPVPKPELNCCRMAGNYFYYFCKEFS